MTQDSFDTIIRNGTVAAASGMGVMDIGISNGKIAALAPSLAGKAPSQIDASDHYVLPGGVDTHCHIEQISGAGLMNADTFETATRSAVFGGTTCTVSFAAQHPGNRMRDVVADYAKLAEKGALIDYAFHMIVADISGENLRTDIPKLIADGHRSIKIFTTYDKVRQDDHAILDIMAVARNEGALVCIHAENDGLIRHMTDQLLAQGKTAPKYHAASHPREAEIEAIDRMCRFAQFTGARVMIFHVSTREGAQIIRKARANGVPIEAETCPHYLLQTVDILERENPARFMCSPPQRTADDQEALWEALADGTLQLITSDHAPYRMDETGKFANGADAPFNRIANGQPGLEVRLPLMFDAIVSRGRGSVQDFVHWTSTAPAEAFGLSKKGSIGVGFDADIAIWNPTATRTYGANDLHDNVGYNPYEGTTIMGFPVTTIAGGEVVMTDGRLIGSPGRGKRVAMAAQR
ncbi:dihydropyrimidinase [Pseudahrensia aquimaris]|uniref:Dihydropyrimidinase n=1 Tax=Pseudahrensia aquimaris TaxID=744461 RepID=A0ABW3FLS4_9HYPH